MIISNSYIDYVKRTMHSSYTKEMAACALIEEVVEFGDASGMQLLAEAMERDGFRTGEIEAVFYGNVMRVYQEIL